MTRTFRRHDPEGIIKDHYIKIGQRLYIHESGIDDIVFQGDLNYEEVEKIIENIKKYQRKIKV